MSCTASNTPLVAAQSAVVRLVLLLPPVRAKIVREWSHFVASQQYNLSCQVNKVL